MVQRYTITITQYGMDLAQQEAAVEPLLPDGEHIAVLAADYDALEAELANEKRRSYWTEYNQEKERAEDAEARIERLVAALESALLCGVLEDKRAPSGFYSFENLDGHLSRGDYYGADREIFREIIEQRNARINAWIEAAIPCKHCGVVLEPCNNMKAGKYEGRTKCCDQCSH